MDFKYIKKLVVLDSFKLSPTCHRRFFPPFFFVMKMNFVLQMFMLEQIT